MGSRTEYEEEQLEPALGVSCDMLGTGEVGKEEGRRREGEGKEEGRKRRRKAR